MNTALIVLKLAGKLNGRATLQMVLTAASMQLPETRTEGMRDAVDWARMKVRASAQL